MNDIIITSKKSAESINAGSNEIRLTEASVVRVGIPSASIKRLERKGDDLSITAASGEVVTLQNFFKTFDGLANELVLQGEQGGKDAVLVGLTEGPTGLVASYTPIDSIDPLLVHKGIDLVGFLPWIFGGGLAAGAAGIAGGRGGGDNAGFVGGAGVEAGGGTGTGGSIGGGAGSGSGGTGSSGNGNGGASGGSGGGNRPPVLSDTVPPAAPTVSPTNGGTIAGTAEPGSTVTVTAGGVVVGSAVVDADGKFTITPSPRPVDGTQLSVSATDPAGNTSPPVTSTVDANAPTSPTVAPTNGGTITGTAEPGSSVSVTAGGIVIGSAVVDADGKFTITPSPHPVDGTQLSVSATDPAGNTSPPVTSTVDANAPTSPTVAPTNGSTVAGTAEPGSTVTVTAGGVVVGSAVVDADGKFTITPSPRPADGTQLSVSAIDPAGNTSPPVTSTVDANAPTAPTVSPTNGSTIAGTAEPGSTVTVTAGGVVVGSTVVDADGKFTITPSPRPADGTEISVSATDSTGNTSPPTTLVVDVSTPTAPTVAPTNGSIITGTAEPGSTVTVSAGGTVIGSAVVDADGEFTITPSPRPVDGTQLSVSVADPAGNTSPPVTSTVDANAPTAPTVAPTNGSTVAGTAEPGSTVTVTAGGTVIGSAVAGDDGKFTIAPSPRPANGTEISVSTTDPAGNTSPATTLAVDATAPSVLIADSAPGIATGDVVFTFTFSEPVSGFDAADVVLSAGTKGTFTAVSSAVYTLVVTPPAASEGTLTVDVPAGAASDSGGTPSAAAVQQSQAFDTAAPSVVGVAITSATQAQNQTLNAGDVLSITVTMSEATTVTGTPELALDIGGTTVQARYVSGSGTGALVFSYTVLAGQADANGIGIAANSLSLNGGTLADAAGNNAVLTHAAVADNPDYMVDTTIGQPMISTFTDNFGTVTGDFEAGTATDDNTPTLNGQANENSTVRIYGSHPDGGYTLLGSTTADSTGAWSFTPRFQVNGDRAYYAQAEDAAGNIGAASNIFTVPILGPTQEPVEVGARYVWSAARVGDVNGDGFDDVLTGIYKGDVRDILLGGPTLGASTIELIPGNEGIYHQSGIGDINGDGISDLVTQYGNRNGDALGNGYVYLGQTTGASWNPTMEFSARGVGAAGDLNGDGLSDFVRIGTREDAQKSSIQYGYTGATTSAPVQPDLNFGMASRGAYNGGQHADAVGDFNGDGLNDMLTSRGIFFGRRDGPISDSADRAWITGPNSRAVDQVQTVSAAGDVNGDGFADVIVQDGYQAFVVFGGTDTGAITLTVPGLGSNGFVIDTSRAGTQVTPYSTVAGIGDVNGDGLSDVAFSTYGNPDTNITSTSTAPVNTTAFAYNDSYVIFGKTDTDAVDPLRLTAKTGIQVPRTQADGASLVGMFDYNGDGLADFFAGSYNNSGGTGNSKLFTGGASLGAQPSDAGGSAGTPASNFLTGVVGTDSAVIVGNGGADVIYAGSGSDTIVLNADNLFYLSQGVQSNGRLARVDGGNGIDTLQLSGVGLLDLTTISNAGIGFNQVSVGMSRIANIERIDLGDGTSDTELKLSLVDVMDMNASANVFNNSTFGAGLGDTVSRHQLVVDGGAGDTVTVADAGQWDTTRVGTVRNGEKSYSIYNTLGGNQGQLLIDTDISVTFVV